MKSNKITVMVKIIMVMITMTLPIISSLNKVLKISNITMLQLSHILNHMSRTDKRTSAK